MTDLRKSDAQLDAGAGRVSNVDNEIREAARLRRLLDDLERVYRPVPESSGVPLVPRRAVPGGAHSPPATRPTPSER
jgi:hypothetical protein